MSASNWNTCPRCANRTDAERARVAALYGKVPIDEFEKLRAALESPENNRTFREDYEIYGADKGEIVVDYSGVCDVCGLEFHFKEATRFYG